MKQRDLEVTVETYTALFNYMHNTMVARRSEQSQSSANTMGALDISSGHSKEEKDIGTQWQGNI